MNGLLRRLKMQARFWWLALVASVTVIAILFITTGGNQTQEAIYVDLDKKSNIVPIRQIGGNTITQPGENTLRVAIAGVLSPTETLKYYQELLDYIGQELGSQVTLILKPTYAEVNDIIRGQRADLGFVCSLAYVKGKQDFSMELLVIPQMYGETVYYSYLIVPSDSNAKSLADLEGASFAFTDPMSNSGHLAPTYQLSLLDKVPVSFFRKYTFTYSHDNSILAVADKLIDAAAVDSLVYDQSVANNPKLASKIKVITSWGPFGIPPIVVSPTLEPQMKQQLRALFLELHHSETGTAILANLAIDRFLVASDGIYDSIREMKIAVGW